MQPVRRCFHCGGSTFGLYWQDDVPSCLQCSRPRMPLMKLADAARLVGISPRTVRRWVDGRQIFAEPPTGRGVPRLVDAAGVIRLVDRRNTVTLRCGWCGRLIEAAGVHRGSRVSRRWHANACKVAAYRASRKALANETSVTVEVPATRRSPANSGRPEASRRSRGGHP